MRHLSIQLRAGLGLYLLSRLLVRGLPAEVAALATLLLLSLMLAEAVAWQASGEPSLLLSAHRDSQRV